MLITGTMSGLYPQQSMSLVTAISVVWGALRDAFPVNPWLAALWLLSALAFAGLLVYAWRRLLEW